MKLLLDRLPESATNEEVKRMSTSAWMLSDIGHAIDVTGAPWPWCPAWFARFWKGPQLADVDRAIRGANWCRRDAAWVMYGMNAAALSPRDARLLAIAWNAMDYIKADAQQRQVEEAKTKGSSQ